MDPMDLDIGISSDQIRRGMTGPAFVRMLEAIVQLQQDNRDLKERIDTLEGKGEGKESIDKRLDAIERELKKLTDAIRIDGSKVTIRANNIIALEATSITINAAAINANTSMSKFTGTVQCDTIIATTVVGSSYTPGAGNVL